MNFRVRDMKKLLKLTPFLLLLFNLSCTEEISDNLKNTDDDVTESIATKAVGNKMSLTHLMDESLSYKIHSTKGRDYPCEIEASGLNFQASAYKKDLQEHAVDCILEVEELDLHFEGVSYELAVDEYLCEYVQYSPFKFFTHPVGATSQYHYEIGCSSDCTSADSFSLEATCSAIEGMTYNTYSGEGAYDGTQFSNPSSPQCIFDYSDLDEDGANCDVGSYYTRKYEVFPVTVPTCEDCDSGGCSAMSEPACLADNGTWNTEYKVCGSGSGNNTLGAAQAEWQETECGGSTLNCQSGPAKDHLPEMWNTGVIYDNKDLDKFTKSWEIAPLIGEHGTNRYIANYSRVFSDVGSKTTYDTSTLFSAFKGYEVETHAPTPNDSGIEKYHKEYIDYNNDGNDDYVLYNTHPFLGVTEYTSVARSATKPYYAFYCLDKSKDIKAQIRLFIREWDRQFDDDQAEMDYLGDCNDADYPCSDTLVDNQGYQNGDSLYNDYRDWDDLFIKDHDDGANDADGAFVNNDISDRKYLAHSGFCYIDDNGEETDTDCATAAGGADYWFVFNEDNPADNWCYYDDGNPYLTQTATYTDKYDCESQSGYSGEYKWIYDKTSDGNLAGTEAFWWLPVSYNFPWWSI